MDGYTGMDCRYTVHICEEGISYEHGLLWDWHVRTIVCPSSDAFTLSKILGRRVLCTVMQTLRVPFADQARLPCTSLTGRSYFSQAEVGGARLR